MTIGGSVSAGRLRDRDVEHRIEDLLAHDDRLRGIADTVAVRVDGGVVHVEGHVPREAHRTLLREAVCGLRGVYALWDGLLVGDQSPLRVVDVGVGATKQKAGAWGLDVVAHGNVDVVADLRRGLPFPDRSVDRVYAVHVLEHLPDLVPLLNELHRVLVPGGILHAMSPHWQHVNAVADPTHVRFFDVQTFKWFCRPRPGLNTWYPLAVGMDGASVLADLTPVSRDVDAADDATLARYFD